MRRWMMPRFLNLRTLILQMTGLGLQASGTLFMHLRSQHVPRRSHSPLTGIGLYYSHTKVESTRVFPGLARVGILYLWMDALGGQREKLCSWVIGYRKGQLGALQPIIEARLTKVVLNWSRLGHGEKWVNMFCVRREVIELRLSLAGFGNWCFKPSLNH